MDRKRKNVVKNMLLVANVAAYPVLFLYFQNIQEVSFQEVAGILFLYIAIGFVIYTGLFWVFRKLNFAGVAACAFMILIFHFMMFQNLVQMAFPNLKYWHILPLLFVLLMHIVYFARYIAEDKYEDFVTILLIVVFGMMCMNLVPALPHAFEKVKVNSERKLTAAENIPVVQKENVYWLLFDECASFTAMEKYYDYYDKTVFDKLQELKFTISDQSRNECIDTNVILTNCLSLDYVANTSMEAAELQELRNNSKLFAIFRENGYEVKGIGDTDWLGIESVSQQSSSGAKTIEGRDIIDLIIDNTVISPFVQFEGNEAAKLIKDTFAYMQEADNISAGNAQFYIMYMCAPHMPFLFDKNGKAVSAQNYNNWEDEKYYREQYIFVMDQMLQSVKTILENDPDSIVIVQSDHGPRHNNEIPYEDKKNILNAVYYKGEAISEIIGKSSVNTLRTVINKHFGYNLKDLEVREGE
ncbi:MAG: LTA synthase family protein [Eubacterium sp.]|nr:LTA synthase family protein [Eubacterium sp.]